ncbi:MAG: hypothetical protein HKN47_25790 [Pirellulaceae bacterium]|nr:hypothetical protein [Pirellulaceae bacterium]
MNNPTHNPFRPPAALDPGKQESNVLYILACLVWVGLTIKIVAIRPVFSAMFEDFGIQMPGLTLWLLDPAMIVYFVVVTGGVILSGWITRSSQTRRRIGWHALVLALLTFVVFVIGLGLPLIRTIEALS